MNNKYTLMVFNFLKKMFSDSGEVSSKRVVGFLTFLLIAESVNAVLWWGKSIPEFMFWGLVTLLGACFGFNAMISMKAIGANSNSSDDGQIPKDIIQSDK